jgi:hypothetical protein
MKFPKKIIVSTITVSGIAITIVLLALYFSEQHTVAQGLVGGTTKQTSLKEIANKLVPIYPQISVVNGSIDNVDGVQLTKITDNSTSNSIIRTNGISKSTYKTGLAQMTLYDGTTNDGKHIVAITLTNIGTSKFFLKELTMGCETNSGIGAFGNSVIDSDYSAQVWGNIPKPTITKLVTLNTGDSISEYMKENWVEPVTNQPFTKLGGAALFFYDNEDKNYNNGFNWGIGVSEGK